MFAVSVYELVEKDNKSPRSELDKLLNLYQNIFSDKAVSDLPASRGSDDHKIPTIPGTKLFTQNPYRLSPKEKEVLRQRLKELIEAGHIRASASAWGAPILFVRKKN